jgi:hypothetical protein
MRMIVNDLEMYDIDKLMKNFYARGDSINLDRHWDHSQQRYMNIVTIQAIEVR